MSGCVHSVHGVRGVGDVLWAEADVVLKGEIVLLLYAERY